MAYTLAKSYLYACPKPGYARNRSRAACFNEGFLKQTILSSKKLAGKRIVTVSWSGDTWDFLCVRYNVGQRLLEDCYMVTNRWKTTIFCGAQTVIRRAL